MESLTRRDYLLLEKLLGSTQEDLLQVMSAYLKDLYSTVKVTKDYICAAGNIPIGLVAHLDTVHPIPVKNLFYDRHKSTLWSPEGLGADDRAGLFIILKIIEAGHRPHIILTTDEEKGGKGAQALAKEPYLLGDLKYLIQLDRRGAQDCVFYDCDNKDFEKYVESFGFKTSWGTFSDISFLCPAWNICGVNLSVGYEYEHSTSELLNIHYLFKTFYKVCKMITQEEIPSFEWKEKIYDKYFIECPGCGKKVDTFETLPVHTEAGNIILCGDCIATYCDWCSMCGRLFLLTEDGQKFCSVCKAGGPSEGEI